jgi:hypothetical protein
MMPQGSCVQSSRKFCFLQSALTFLGSETGVLTIWGQLLVFLLEANVRKGAPTYACGAIFTSTSLFPRLSGSRACTAAAGS